MAGKTRDRLRSLSGPKKALAGAVAVAAGIVALWGAFKAIDEAYKRYRDWRDVDTPSQLTVTPSLGLQVWQDGVQNDMFFRDGSGDDQVVTIPMEARPFQVRVPRQPDDRVIGLGVWSDESNFQLPVGESTEPTQFGLGKGMAASTFGVGNLVLTKEAFNAFAGERLEHVGDRDAIFVSTFSRLESDQTTPVTNQQDDLFLVVYIDKNNDQIVDFDEYEYIVLDF